MVRLPVLEMIYMRHFESDDLGWVCTSKEKYSGGIGRTEDKADFACGTPVCEDGLYTLWDRGDRRFLSNGVEVVES